jgi:hypothetical protein
MYRQQVEFIKVAPTTERVKGMTRTATPWVKLVGFCAGCEAYLVPISEVLAEGMEQACAALPARIERK